MHELNEMPDQTYDADWRNQHAAAITQIKKVKLNFLDLLHEYKKRETGGICCDHWSVLKMTKKIHADSQHSCPKSSLVQRGTMKSDNHASLHQC